MSITINHDTNTIFAGSGNGISIDSLGVFRVKAQDTPTVSPLSVISAPTPKYINGEWVEIYAI
jgi:hypothetical protein